MNVEELKAALTTMADDASEPGPDVARLNDVWRRVRVTRRKRTLALVSAFSLAVAATVVAFAAGPSTNDSHPAPTHPAGLSTLTDHGIPFYRSPVGNTLIAHRVGQPGQSSVSFTFVPQSAVLRYAVVCSAPYVRNNPYFVHLMVGGYALQDATCTGGFGIRQPDHRMFLGFDSPVAGFSNLPLWTAAAPGLEAYVQVSITRGLNGSVITVPNAQIGVALYQRSKEVLHEHGYIIDRRVVQADHAYRLVSHTLRTLSTRGTAHVRLPASDQPLWVVSGVQQWSSSYRLGLAGDRLTPWQHPGASLPIGRFVSSSNVQQASLTVQGRSGSSGLAYVLVYERVD